MSKLVFFSDIHGNKYAFDQFLEALEKEKPDYVFFLGDVFGYYYHAEEIITQLRSRGILSLLGNHDQFFLDIIEGKMEEHFLIEKYGNAYRHIADQISPKNIAFVRSLSPYMEFTVDHHHLGLFHGNPDNPLNGRVYPDADAYAIPSYQKYNIVVLGHTHHKMIKTFGKTLVLNPGSLGQQRDGTGCSYLTMTLPDMSIQWKIIPYNIALLEKDIDRYDYGNPRLKEVLRRKVAL